MNEGVTKSMNDKGNEKAERLRNNGWIWQHDTSEIVTIGNMCPSCHQLLHYYKKTMKDGRTAWIAACTACGFESRFLKTRKNADRRTGSTQSKWRASVLQNDGYECRICGSKESLEAHHIVPVCADKNLERLVSNGVCLCHKCHMKCHGNAEETT